MVSLVDRVGLDKTSDADLGLRCLHTLEDMFPHCAAYMMTIFIFCRMTNLEDCCLWFLFCSAVSWWHSCVTPDRISWQTWQSQWRWMLKRECFMAFWLYLQLPYSFQKWWQGKIIYTLSTRGKIFGWWHNAVFFLFFLESIFWHFMQIVSNGDSLHEMSKAVFWE